MKKIFLYILIPALAFFIINCGLQKESNCLNGNDTSCGKLNISIHWPSSNTSKYIPANTSSIAITVVKKTSANEIIDAIDNSNVVCSDIISRAQNPGSTINRSYTLPTGDFVAFIQAKDVNGNIIASNRSTFTLTSGASVTSEAYMDTKIAFNAPIEPGQDQIYIWTANADGTNKTNVQTGLAGGNISVSWSSSGNQLYFYNRPNHPLEGNEQIYSIKPDGTELTPITTESNNIQPYCSPAGDKIVFARDVVGNFEIFTMNTGGTNMQRLTTSAGIDDWPAFSPDGDKIAFISRRNGGNKYLYIMNSDGTNQIELTSAVTCDWRPSFSNDGTKIIFASENERIYVINVDGTNLQSLGAGTSPAFSNHTSHIICSYTPPGEEENSYIMNEDGSNKIRLGDTVGENFTWSP